MTKNNTEKTTETALTTIESAVDGCSIETIHELPVMQQTMAMAKGMTAIKAALTDDVVNEVFMPLMGNRLGFRTDKDNDPPNQRYDVAVVRNCAIEAMIRGLRPIGNEWNIIAGSCYVTKEGLERTVAEFPGLTDLALKPGVPQNKEGGALVPYAATWRLNGQKGSMSCDVVPDVGDFRIPVRVNRSMGVDAILGKAKRKFLARLLERIAGITTPGSDAEDDAIDISEAISRAAKGDDLQKTNATGNQAEDLASKHAGQAGENGGAS